MSVESSPGRCARGYTPRMIPTLSIGVDENGLGPKLGPMVVTAALVSLTAPAAEVSTRLQGVVGDSKGLCAHGDMARVESLVLAILESHLGLRPSEYDALRLALALQPEAELRALCPAGASPEVCFGARLELPAFGGVVDARARRDAEAVREAGMTLRSARQAYACAKALNVAKANGRSRFDVDLDLMIALAARLREEAGATVDAVCGKVGGRKSYAPALTAAWPLLATEVESQAESRYEIPRFGRLRFLRDADASEPAVSLASLIGKYARELATERAHRYFRAALPTLAPCSGYHDPVTARYIDATALLRAQRGVREECFVR
jgi:ribonuclease HII